MAGRSSPITVSTKLHKIATLAREAPDRVLTPLAHHIDVDFLREAYRRTRKDGATGVDGQTAAEYAEDLEANLQSLLDRLKSGAYVAPPVRRAYVPKDEGGEFRPIGIPTFEDRVIKVDIKSYFDTLSHRHLRGFLDQRVRDGVIRRMIDKWLKAGVLEEESLRFSDAGVPQGSSVAPILSNVFLHWVFDHWFEHEVRPRLTGEAVFYRFADDIVVVCALERDAHRIMAVLPKRFGKYGLMLHPDKTRVIRFRRPPYRSNGGRGHHLEWPESFDLLGFTHYWGRSRHGNWVIKRKTAKGRLSRALKRINTWCRRYRHAKVGWQHQQLVLKVRGHYAYYGITGNDRGLKHFRYGVMRRWKRWLNRRSHRSGMDWDRFNLLLKHYPLPDTRVRHATLRA